MHSPGQFLQTFRLGMHQYARCHEDRKGVPTVLASRIRVPEDKSNKLRDNASHRSRCLQCVKLTVLRAEATEESYREVIAEEFLRGFVSLRMSEGMLL